MNRFLQALKKVCLHPFGSIVIDGVATVRPSGRDTFLYVEGNHRMTVYAELLMGQPERRMYFRSIGKWLPPFENEAITLDTQRAIVNRMRKYFDSQGISCEVIDT